jgi:hypothetical protein
MEKGINLQIEELKVNLANIINTSNMPVTIIEMVLQGMLAEANILKQRQVSKEKQDYDNAVAEKDKKEK